MILTADRGKPFKEDFTFKDSSGRTIPTPVGAYAVTLSHGNFIKVFSDLNRGPAGVYWTMTPQDTQGLEYSTLYFVLTFNGQEITRGVLRVQ